MVIAGCSGTVFIEGSWSNVLKERTRSGKIAVPCGGWEEGALSSTCRERANGQGGGVSVLLSCSQRTAASSRLSAVQGEDVYKMLYG